MVVEVCPYTQEYLDARDRNATFVADIGQSGGNRGYQALTGVSKAKCIYNHVCACSHVYKNKYVLWALINQKSISFNSFSW